MAPWNGPNYTSHNREEDQWVAKKEKAAAAITSAFNSSHVTLSQHLLSFVFFPLWCDWILFGD